MHKIYSGKTTEFFMRTKFFIQICQLTGTKYQTGSAFDCAPFYIVLGLSES